MDLSKIITCRHCSNMAHFEIIGNVQTDETDPNFDEEYGPEPNHGTRYEIMKCPACKEITIVSFFWHEDMDSEDDFEYNFLYPQTSNAPIGLPPAILKTYLAAEKIKSFDVNSYVLIIRRLLEMVCIDRSAEGSSLADMLRDLAAKREIPDKLVSVANGLKDFGNIGAHGVAGDLTKEEIPIVDALNKAILEYIYSAPHLATQAEKKLKVIMPKKKKA